MSITCAPAAPAEWAALVAASPEGTFFDSDQWQNRFAFKTSELLRLKFTEHGAPVAAVGLGLERQAGGGYLAKSPFSAPFGGVLPLGPLPLSRWVDIISRLKDFLRASLTGPIRVVYIQRGSHLALSPEQSQLHEFALKYCGFAEENVMCELLVAASDEPQLAARAKTALNRAEREGGLVFSEGEPEAFLRLRQMAVVSQNKTITVPDEEIIAGRRLFPDHIRFWQVSRDRRPLAMLLEDRLNDRVSVGRNWFRDSDFSDQPATLKLLYEWIRVVKRDGRGLAGLGASLQLKHQPPGDTLRFKERLRPTVFSLRKTYVADLD